MSPRLLVLDAYDDAGRRALSSVGATHAGVLYARLLERLCPGATVDVASFRESGFALPSGSTVADYDGVVWTGSNLTIHQDTPAVRDQLAFARQSLAAGLSSFGSCWAAQVAVTATGGRCEANPRGREFGIGRQIVLTAAGRAHPMFEGKASVFDAPTSHEDHVVELGPHATLLASNEFSAVQAVSVEHGPGSFWAVQYHPEFSLFDVARLGVLRAPQLVAQGFLRSREEAEAYAAELESLERDPARKDIAFRLGIGPDVLDVERRTREVANWIRRRVAPGSPSHER